MMLKRLALIIIVILLMVTTIANAQGGFDLTWWTIGGSGGQSSGDVYSLQGIAGQANASVIQGGDFRMAGGYLGGGTAPLPSKQYQYLPYAIK